MKTNKKEDALPVLDVDPRVAGYRRPPGVNRLQIQKRIPEASDSMVASIKAMLQGMLGGLLHGPSKHGYGGHKGMMKKAVERRRMRNKMARKSRRINRMYA